MTEEQQPDDVVKTPAMNIPLSEVVDCPIELLELDRDNPRLMTGTEYHFENENDVIRAIFSIADVSELIISICDNKYLNLEPLIIYSDSGKPPYTVLEGNRRLTAIKLIRNSSLAESLGVKLPTVTQEVLDSTDAIKVFRVATHEDARAFIGFKHINGPQRWDAYAKARFATEWYKSEHDSGITIDDIATKLGDNHNTIRSLVSSLLLLDQAEESGVYNINDRTNPGRFAFSHLYTALGRPEYREFLGLELGWDKNPSAVPIPPEKLPVLGEMLTFVYGSKSANIAAKVKSQNPDLKNLGKVLANDVALTKLRSGAELYIAFEDTLPPSRVLADAMTAAHLQLVKAIELASKVDAKDITESTVSIVKEITTQAKILSLYVNDARNNSAS